MFPIGTTPSSLSYPITIAQAETAWTVTVGPSLYDFGENETAAQAFADAAKSTAALVEWYARAKALLRQMEALLSEAGLLRVLYEDNGLLALMLATPQGSPVPGPSLPLGRLLSIGCLFQDLTAFLATDVVGVPPAPIPLGLRRVVITLRD